MVVSDFLRFQDIRITKRGCIINHDQPLFYLMIFKLN